MSTDNTKTLLESNNFWFIVENEGKLIKVDNLKQYLLNLYTEAYEKELKNYVSKTDPSCKWPTPAELTKKNGAEFYATVGEGIAEVGSSGIEIYKQMNILELTSKTK